MSGEERDRSLDAKKGDLVICLDTGSIGVVLKVREDNWLISFPHGNYLLNWGEFDVLKSG